MHPVRPRSRQTSQTLRPRTLPLPTIPFTSSARKTKTFLLSRFACILTPSATALSSARTTKRSRCTSTRTFRGTPWQNPRNTARWSLPRSRTCACSTTTWQKAARPVRRMISNSSSRNWNPASRPSRGLSRLKNRLALWPSAQAKVLPVCSAIWGPTASSKADRP